MELYKSVMRRFSISHITFMVNKNNYTAGIKLDYACIEVRLLWLIIFFWHEHNIIRKYPYKVLNPKAEAIENITKSLDNKMVEIFDSGLADFGGWTVEEVEQIDDDKVFITANATIHLEREFSEVMIKESVDRAEREYQEKLKLWNSYPWYVKVFPQLGGPDVYW